jgi:hypothetical protein
MHSMNLRRLFTFFAQRRQRKAAHHNRRDFEARIAAPDWTFYERHLQRPIPTALRELYTNRRLVLDSWDYPKIFGAINSFLPLHESALLSTQACLGFDIVPIATGEVGEIFLRPGSSMDDNVFILYSDGDFQEIAPDVATFIQRLKAGAGTSGQHGEVA